MVSLPSPLATSSSIPAPSASLPDESNTKGLRVYLPRPPDIPAKRVYKERRRRIKRMRTPTTKPKADQAVSSFAAPALVVAAQFLRK
jgi:hypothetical protein